jgi:cytochrome c oxidase assembly protein subunit 15
MAVPDWPTTFGINMFLYNMLDAPWGVYIEHSHRLFGALVGVAAIVLAAWIVAADRRRWMKFVGAAALLAVVVQGLIGGTRVLENSTYYAAIHGCSGQLVFAFLVAVCVLTGRDWLGADSTRADVSHLRRRAAVTTALIYGQIVAGALLRHFGAGLVVHAVLAAAVWGHVAFLFARVERSKADLPWLVAPSRSMAALVTLQVVLGIGAWWMLRPFDGIARPVTNLQALARSGHVVNGALLLASSLVLTLRSFRHLRTSPIEGFAASIPARRALEAVA